MDERSTGPWAILKRASVYTALQTMIGGPGLRRYIVDHYIRPRHGDYVLDVGCGPADFATLMPEVHYVGVDHNPAYIAHAQAHHGRPTARFLNQDVAAEGFEFEESFDVILMIGLLHHLDDARSRDLLTVTRRCLRPDGRVFSIDPTWTTPQHWLARLIIANDRGQHVRTPDACRQLAETVFGRVATEVRTDLLRVPYTHLVMECAA